MHTLEPFFNWRHLYIASEDSQSPFSGYQNSEVYFTHAIYDHVIHPQWDELGSSTLFMKQLYADYDTGYTILEFIGEWNDAIENDVMRLKRNILEPMMDAGIDKFILIGENILNFHGSDDCYYEEWFDEIEDGWIAMVNFREHILEEMTEMGIDNYLISGGKFMDFSWRTAHPDALFKKVEAQVQLRLGNAF